MLRFSIGSESGLVNSGDDPHIDFMLGPLSLLQHQWRLSRKRNIGDVRQNPLRTSFFEHRVSPTKISQTPANKRTLATNSLESRAGARVCLFSYSPLLARCGADYFAILPMPDATTTRDRVIVVVRYSLCRHAIDAIEIMFNYVGDTP